jgi:nucleotide-binding universal stress UspA family protein
MSTDLQRPLAPAPAGPAEYRPPGPGRPLICAVDDDGLASGVLATGAALADHLDVPLTVVHSPHHDTFLTGEPYRLAIERGHELVDRLTDGYRVDARVVEVDDPGRLITAVADEGASMIVLGSPRRTGLRAAVLGSVSEAVVASAPCPVVTVSELAGRASRLRRGPRARGSITPSRGGPASP